MLLADSNIQPDTMVLPVVKGLIIIAVMKYIAQFREMTLALFLLTRYHFHINTFLSFFMQHIINILISIHALLYITIIRIQKQPTHSTAVTQYNASLANDALTQYQKELIDRISQFLICGFLLT